MTHVNYEQARDAIVALLGTVDGPAAPLADAVATRVRDLSVTVAGGATFGPDRHRQACSSTVNVSTATDWSRRDVVSHVEVTVYGAMTYRDDRDDAATVTLRYYPTRSTEHRSWVARRTRATRWNGKAWTDMPTGARDRIADAVAGVLADLLADDDAWAQLALEEQRRDWHRDLKRKMSDAADAIAAASTMLERGPLLVPMPEVAS